MKKHRRKKCHRWFLIVSLFFFSAETDVLRGCSWCMSGGVAGEESRALAEELSSLSDIDASDLSGLMRTLFSVMSKKKTIKPIPNHKMQGCLNRVHLLLMRQGYWKVMSKMLTKQDC